MWTPSNQTPALKPPSANLTVISACCCWTCWTNWASTAPTTVNTAWSASSTGTAVLQCLLFYKCFAEPSKLQPARPSFSSTFYVHEFHFFQSSDTSIHFVRWRRISSNEGWCCFVSADLWLEMKGCGDVSSSGATMRKHVQTTHIRNMKMNFRNKD